MKRVAVSLLLGLVMLAGITTAPVTATSYPFLVVKPEQVQFDEVEVGSQSAPQIISIGSGVDSTFTLMIFKVYLEGPDQEEFAIVEDNCSGRMFDPTMSSTVVVTFTPHSAGPKKANLTIESHANLVDLVSIFSIKLQGTGVGTETKTTTVTAATTVTSTTTTTELNTVTDTITETTTVTSTTGVVSTETASFPWWAIGAAVAAIVASFLIWRILH